MKKKKSNCNKFKNRIFLKILFFFIMILIVISGFIYFKYWFIILFLYNDVIIKVNNCIIDIFNINKLNNINILNNKDLLYLNLLFIF